MLLALLLAAAPLAPLPPAWGPLPELAALERALRGEAGGAPSTDARVALLRAARLSARGRYAEAAGELAAAGADPILGPWARLARARALLAAGRPDEAGPLLAQLAGDQDGAVARAARGRAAAARGGPAVAGLEGALRGARRLLNAGEPAAAHADLLLAVAKAGPGSPRAARGELFLGEADRVLGREDEALAHWRAAAASRDPAVAAAARIALARELEDAGDWKPAVELLGRVAAERRERPEGRDAAFFRAWMLLRHGEEGRALAGFCALGRRPRRRRGGEALWWEGRIEYLAARRARRSPEARARARSAVRAWAKLVSLGGPSRPRALYWLAKASGLAGDRRRADATRARLLALAPGSYYALLAGGGAATGSAPRCEPRASEAAGILLRRAAWLWALGDADDAGLELSAAARRARGPAESSAVAEADGALARPGAAFRLAAAGRAPCADVSGLLFPRPFREEVERAARAAGVDPILIWSIMRQESRFTRGARSAQQARGVMQLLGRTRERIAAITGTAVREGVGSDVAFAAWYLRALVERFGSDAAVAAAYNAGPEAVTAWVGEIGRRPLDEWIERIPFKETRGYVEAVLANEAGYRARYGSGRASIDARPPAGEPRAGIDF